jgi:hypothetical protein
MDDCAIARGAQEKIGCWLKRLIEPTAERRLDTDLVPRE